MFCCYIIYLTSMYSRIKTNYVLTEFLFCFFFIFSNSKSRYIKSAFSLQRQSSNRTSRSTLGIIIRSGECRRSTNATRTIWFARSRPTSSSGATKWSRTRSSALCGNASRTACCTRLPIMSKSAPAFCVPTRRRPRIGLPNVIILLFSSFFFQ